MNKPELSSWPVILCSHTVNCIAKLAEKLVGKLSEKLAEKLIDHFEQPCFASPWFIALPCSFTDGLEYFF